MADQVRAFIEALGPFGGIGFVLLYVVLTVLFVPGTIPSVAAGALFGPLWGTMLTLAGATLGAAAAFEIARRLGRERVRERLGRRTQIADRWVHDQGLLGVIALRLIPVVPFNALNYAFGLSSVARRSYLIGTAVGIIPGTTAFVVLGSSLADPRSPGFIGSVAAVLMLIAVSTYRTRHSPPPAPERPAA
ncbi:MAG: TVP38/TMEM64 family protein [Thermoleophilaceae bacterium]